MITFAKIALGSLVEKTVQNVLALRPKRWQATYVELWTPFVMQLGSVHVLMVILRLQTKDVYWARPTHVPMNHVNMALVW